MKRLWSSHFLLATCWTRWRRFAARSICLGAILFLGALRIANDAELTFVSLALLPVLVIAWIDGRRNGLFAALLASAMWAVSDMAQEREFSAQWIPWANMATRLVTYSLAALLVAQVRLQFEREHERATRDVLTGLHNRRAFLEAGDSEVDRAKRYAHPLAVVFLDLDDFKHLNDSRGHDAGDAALRATATGLLGVLRSSDRVARLGGDEFAVLLPETRYDAAVEAGRKISLAVNAALAGFPPVRTSVGVAWFADADRLFPAMLKAADELMYEIKESGKDDMRCRRFATPPTAEREA